MNTHLRQHTDIMLDLETFGSGQNAAIVSIGAVAFTADVDNTHTSLFTLHPGSLEEVGHAFHRRINLSLTSDPELRGTIDASTIEWWMSQSDEARASLVQEPRHSLGSALHAFCLWVSDTFRVSPREVRMWSNGPTFDERLIREAFDRYDLEFPLSFRGSRCCRTMTDLAKLHGWDFGNCNPQSSDILKHNAMHDAVYQARVVVLQRAYLSSLIETAKGG